MFNVPVHPVESAGPPLGTPRLLAVITMSMKKALAGLIYGLALLCGCSKIEGTKLGDADQLWGGYERNAVYKLQADVFLLKLSEPYENASIEFSLTPEASFRAKANVYGAPDSIRAYLEDGEASVQPSTGRGYVGTSSVAGVVASGTRIRATEAIRYRVWSWFFGAANHVVVYAEILDGEYKGARVDIQDLSDTENSEAPMFGSVTILNPTKFLLDNADIGTPSPKARRDRESGQPT